MCLYAFLFSGCSAKAGRGLPAGWGFSLSHTCSTSDHQCRFNYSLYLRPNCFVSLLWYMGSQLVLLSKILISCVCNSASFVSPRPLQETMNYYDLYLQYKFCVFTLQTKKNNYFFFVTFPQSFVTSVLLRSNSKKKPAISAH